VTVYGAFGPDRDLSFEDASVRKAGLSYLPSMYRVARRNIGFADDPLQEAVVASAIGEASDPSRLARPIFRVPRRLAETGKEWAAPP
jgi:hypothetical protein